MESAEMNQEDTLKSYITTLSAVLTRYASTVEAEMGCNQRIATVIKMKKMMLEVVANASYSDDFAKSVRKDFKEYCYWTSSYEEISGRVEYYIRYSLAMWNEITSQLRKHGIVTIKRRG